MNMEHLKDDITHWILKVKNGVILSGHDYGFPEIKKAVNEILGSDSIRRTGDCWIYYKN